MRKIRVDHLLAGTMLALIASTPATSVWAAPDRVESTMPPPPALNSRHIIRRDATPSAPPPAYNSRAQTPARVEPARIEPARIEPAPVRNEVAAPPPAATDANAQGNDNNNSDSRGVLDRMLAASDQQITEKLREQITGKQLEKRIERPADRKAIETYYATHGYAPLWIRDGRLTSRAQAVIARLKNAEADGLDAGDYPVPEFSTFTGADALAEGDIKLTNSAITFARNLQSGRIAPNRVLAEVDYGNHTPEPGDTLKKIADASDENAALESFNPQHAGFRALKEKLAELRGPMAQADDRIADGPMLKPGMKDSRVPKLREKLGVAGKPDDLTYDIRLANAIKNVQHRDDIKPTGVLDSKTLNAINGPKASQKLDTVLANMERWRWLPRDLGRTYVMVNIPDYTLKVVHDHQVVWRTKIVSGKPQTPTPLASATMDNVVLNPSWYVPQSIIQNELLPLYAHDPQIFDRMGLEVKRGPDGNINVVQPPGAANALGRIKFNFPNKFQVYLHDTPEKRLFAADKRAFSHGCMRVEDPTKFGEIILHLAMNGPTPNSQQLYSQFGKEEYTYRLINRPQVHLTYQTAYVDDAGKLVIRDDLYGFDARIHAIMHSDERRIADVAPPQDPKREATTATAKSNQEILRRVERREASNPFAFFEQLFR
jgi:murein L,D-transpeptidase YcbB/YkuD